MMELPKRHATSLYGQPAHSARIGLLCTSAVRQRGLGDGKGAAAGGVATMDGGSRAARLSLRPGSALTDPPGQGAALAAAVSRRRPDSAPWCPHSRCQWRRNGGPLSSGGRRGSRFGRRGRGTIPRVRGRRRPH
jgi:hypothetical protein